MSMARYVPTCMPFNAAQVRWNRDIECGVAAMTTTGGHLWNASERLAGVALPCNG